MIIETIELKKIKANEGFVLTNGTIYTQELILSKNDIPDNWYEISKEQYTQIITEAELAMLKEQN